MHNPRSVIGVDIGTTSTKAVLFDVRGQIVTSAAVEYPLHAPQPAAAEQDPDEIYRAVITTIRRVVRDGAIGRGRLACIAFSSMMHSVIAVDRDGQPLTRCITWADNRSAPWAEKLKHELGGDRIYRRTGTPIHPMSPLPKLLWLRDTQPELFKSAARFISIKEYVFHRLFGEYVADYSIASATGMLNLDNLDWDSEALAVAGVKCERLSTLVPTTHQLHGLDPALASDLGIPADTPFVVGASDGVLSNLGVDAIAPGVVAATVGTSGAIRTVIDRPATDPKGRTFCYALTDKLWVIGGPVNNGGLVFRWIRDEFAAAETETAKRLGIDPYDVLTHIAERVPPGSDGLVFHPYLAGERAPLWNPDARASFFGLTLHHRKEHMIRAALEGVIYNLCMVLLILEEQIGAARRIQATGGFAHSSLWRQIMADIFNRAVHIPTSIESSCLGAAVLGLYALGEVDSLQAVSGMVGTTHNHAPIAEHAAIYKRLFPLFVDLPAKLNEEYARIASFQNEAPGPTRHSNESTAGKWSGPGADFVRAGDAGIFAARAMPLIVLP